MPTVVDRRPVTDALLEMLRTGTGMPIGDSGIADSDLVANKPWAILYLIPGGGTWGPPLAAPDEAAELVYQVSSIGRRRDQAEWMADTVRRTMLARISANGHPGEFQVAFPASGAWKVIDRQLDGWAGVDKTGNPPNEIWTVPERYRLVVTSA